MKTFKEAKDQVAKSKGFVNFEETYVTKRKDWSIGEIYEEAAELYARSMAAQACLSLIEKLHKWNGGTDKPCHLDLYNKLITMENKINNETNS